MIQKYAWKCTSMDSAEFTFLFGKFHVQLSTRKSFYDSDANMDIETDHSNITIKRYCLSFLLFLQVRTCELLLLTTNILFWGGFPCKYFTLSSQQRSLWVQDEVLVLLLSPQSLFLVDLIKFQFFAVVVPTVSKPILLEAHLVLCAQSTELSSFLLDGFLNWSISIIYCSIKMIGKTSYVAPCDEPSMLKN